MDCFIDVMVSGDKEQVAEANKYVELIHNRIGGIQTPVEVDINFKEGEVKSLDDVTDAAVRAAQEKAEAEAAQAQAQAEAAKADALAKAEAAKANAVAEVDAQQQALTERIEANRMAAQERAAQYREASLQQAADVNEAELEAATVNATAGANGLATDQADQEAINAQRQAVLNSAEENEPRQEGVMSSTTEPSSSTFADLTSPEAIEARDIYTSQKLESMMASAIDKISAVKGIHLYFRDGLPDALDMDADVLFQGMHYNMGLVDQEPPARFANLNGLSIVFDFTAKLPTRLEKNENNQKAPLLSMAIVPQCHAIDRALGEAYAIDFSVLETVNPVDNWVMQVVQHGRDGKYYVVRQLEGFTPVYHQILWNGRKGIIGPELPCGKYTLVLTATDLKGQKQTLRRRVIVKCSAQKTSSAKKTASGDELCAKCNYKTPRLWKKPARFMKAAAAEEQTAPATDTYGLGDTTGMAPAAADPLTDTMPDTLGTSSNAAYAPMPSTDPYAAPQGTVQPSTAPAELPVNNPYDMPYEQYGN